jgi:hypothetical protein
MYSPGRVYMTWQIGSHLKGFVRSFSKQRQVTLQWKLKNGEIQKTPAEIGISFMEIAHRNNIDLEGALSSSFLPNVITHLSPVCLFRSLRRCVCLFNVPHHSRGFCV